MGKYTLQAQQDVTLTVDGQEVQLRANQAFTTDDACQAVNIIHAWQEHRQAAGQDTAVSELREGLFNDALRECLNTTFADILDPVPPDTPAEDQNLALPFGDGSPGPSGDTSDSLNAPDPQPAAGLSGERTPSADSNASPGAQHHDRDDPRPLDDIAGEASSQGATSDQAQQAAEDARRNEPRDGERHHDFSDGRRDTPVESTDPVSIFSGEFTLTSVDVELASEGIPLRLERIYRSGRVFYGPWGFQWDHNYNLSLRVLSDGNVAVWTGHLSEDIYVLQADGSFAPPIATFRLLERDAGAPDERWILSERYGRQVEFTRPPGWPLPDRLPMTAIEDRNGNRHELSHDAQGRLERVGDDAGRSLTFSYGACGLLEQVVDHTGRRWTYLHDDGIEHLVGVLSPATDEFPEGRRQVYEYDRFNAHPVLQHTIISVVDGDGRVVVENRYGQDPASDDFARVVWQEVDQQITLFEAERLQYVPRVPEAVNVPALRINVLDPGYLFVYTFNYRGDLLDRRFRLTVDGSYRLVADTYRYDEWGNLVSQYDSDGRGIVCEYDTANADPRARGNLLRVTRLASPLNPAPPIELFRATYEPLRQQLQSYRDALGGITGLIYDHDLGPGGVGDLLELRRPQYTQPDGTLVTPVERFAYNARGQLLEHDQDGELHRFEHTPAGLQRGFCVLVRHERAGVSLEESYTRDDIGNILTKTDGLGHTTTYEVDAFNLVRSTTRANAETWRFGYDAVGRLRSIVEPRGEYDDPVLAGAGIRHEYGYSPAGYLVSERFAANTVEPREFSYSRSAEGRTVRERHPQGLTITRTLDERGLVLSEDSIDDAGTLLQRRSFRYGRCGELAAMRVEGGGEIRLEYDGFQRLRRVIDLEGTRYEYERNAAGLATRVTVEGRTGGDSSATGLLAEQRREFDEAGHLRVVRDSVFDQIGGAESTLEAIYWVDPQGRMMRRRDPNGLETSYEHGPLGLLLQGQDTLGNGDSYVYDACGRIIERHAHEADSAGLVRSFDFVLEYDSIGRVVSETGPLAESAAYRYDARNNLVEATNPLGSQMFQRFNAFGEIVSQRLGGSEMQWERDAGGQVLRLIDPTGAATRFERDVLSRIQRVVRSDGAEQVHRYRPDGVLDRLVDYDGTVVDIESTAAGQPMRIRANPAAAVAPTPELRYEYDGLRRMVRAQAGAHVIDCHYDSIGRLRREDDGTPLTVSYGASGSELTIDYPDGRSDERLHDLAGRIRTIRHLAGGTLPHGLPPGSTVLEVDWEGAARPALAQMPAGVTRDWRYDIAGRLVAMGSSSPGTEHLRQTLIRDSLGLLRALDVQAGLARRLVTQTDELQRITQIRRDFADGILPADPTTSTQAVLDAAIAASLAAPAASATSFSWTAADTPLRREELDGAGAVVSATSFTTNTLHRLTSVGDDAIGYDARGDIVSAGSRGYRYDAFGRLVSVEQAAVQELELSYDALGRVATVEQGGVTRSMRYLGQDLLEVREGATLVEQRTIGLRADQPAAVHLAAGTFFPVYDEMGSTVALLDAAGNVAERYVYDLFGFPEIRSPDGSIVLASSSVGFVPHYHGRPWFAAAELYDFRHRAYVPLLLGFLQPDPVPFSASWSHYGFARYNPYCFTDPDGTWIHLAIGAAIGAAIGGIGTALSGGDGWDILVGIGAGAVGGAVTAAGAPIAGAAIAGGIMGGWSGGRIGYQMGGTQGAVIGVIGGGLAGAGLGAFTGAVGSRVASAVGTRVYGSVFNAAVNRGVTATTATAMARGSSMVAGGYAGGASAGVLGNTASTIGVDLATGQPITATQIGTAIQDGLTRDGALGVVGASADRYALVARIPGMTGNRWGTLPGRANTGLEGEILVGKALGVEPSRGADSLLVNGRTRRPDFPLNQTTARDQAGNLVQNIPEVKNKARLSTTGQRSDVAQIEDFAAAAAAGGGDVIVYHRPGMDTSPLNHIPNLVTLPIPQQPMVLPLPFGMVPRRRPGEGSK